MEMEHEQYSAYVSASSELFTSVEVPGSAEPASSERFTSVEVPGSEEPASSELFTAVEVPGNEEPAPSTGTGFSKLFFEYRSEDIEVRHQIGEGGQGMVYEVLLNTGARFGGGTPKYETCAAKLFHKGHYGQLPEHVNGLADCYGGYICQFYGYCREFNSPKIDEKDSFCLLMKKYDCSLYNIIEQEKKKENFSGRPFKTGIALNMIVQIAVGMEILHKANLLHRDLKTDNIFVYKDADDYMPWGAYIGDFDIGGNVHGTLFWRAPEILESLAKRLPPAWTAEADVYSFGMVCYEIVTGDAPLLHLAWKMGFKNVQEAVCKKGLRPELPADLHPKIKDLIVKCWNPDPLQRPSSTAIVTELKTIFKPFPELRVFLQSMERIQSVLPPTQRPTPEECLSSFELKLDELRLKYPPENFGYQPGDIDFVMTGYQLLKSLRKFVLKFGYQPYIDRPSLPLSMWFERDKLLAKCMRLSHEFDLELPNFDGKLEIIALRIFISDSICKNREVSNSFTEEEGINAIELLARMKAWSKKLENLPPLLDRHHGCVQRSNYGEYEGDKDYPICDFCKDENPSMVQVENARIQTFFLFHPDHKRTTSFFGNKFRR